MPDVIDAILLNEYRKKALTAYNRLESSPRTAEFDRSLKAEVRDALWMLTRQWQFGEFKGEDAASAVTTQIEREHTIMDRISFPGNNNFAYGSTVPLETVVERESIRPNLDLAVKLGRYLIRLMRGEGVFTTTILNSFISKYPLNYTINNNDVAGKQLSVAVMDKVFDGLSVLSDIDTPDGGGTRFQTWVSNEGLPAALINLGNKLKACFRRIYSQPSTDVTAWLPAHLEYSFHMASAVQEQTPQIKPTLVADQYSDGHLDWYSFDFSKSIETPLDVGMSAERQGLEPVSFIPSAASFKGMPNPRYWMMEDSKTNFGKMDTSPTGLLHLLLAEFGLIYSNDWFVLPYPLLSNTLCELKNIIVTDTFGQQILIRPSGQGAEENWQRWTLFRHTDRDDRHTNTNLFYLAPVITRSLDGPPLEQINFLRDEMANLVWGVETIVPSQSGKGMRGNEMAMDVQQVQPIAPEQPDDEKPKIKYVLGTIVPDNWTPFMPVHMENSSNEVRLQRARMPQAQGPYGVILNEKAAPYYINEEEIGRSGTLVQRNWQLTSWHNGKRFLWIARSKVNGKGEGWSNLKFDQIENI
jgi:hypothetical protein